MQRHAMCSQGASVRFPQKGSGRPWDAGLRLSRSGSWLRNAVMCEERTSMLQPQAGPEPYHIRGVNRVFPALCLLCQHPTLSPLPGCGIQEGIALVLLICRALLCGIAPCARWHSVSVTGKVQSLASVITFNLILSQFQALAYDYIKPCVRMIYNACFNTATITSLMK